jgi:hypothetical protein
MSIYSSGPSDHISNFADSAQFLRSMSDIPVPVDQSPQDQSGLSQLRSTARPEEARGTDLIQRGISALFTKGQELTGPITQQLASGGLVDTPYYKQVMTPSNYPYYTSATSPGGDIDTPYYKGIMSIDNYPYYTSATSPGVSSRSAIQYTPIPSAPSPIDTTPTPTPTPYLSDYFSSVLDEQQSDSYGLTGDPADMTGPSPSMSPDEVSLNKSVADLAFNPVLASAFGISPSTAKGISRAGSLASMVGGPIGAIGGLASLANMNPLDALALAVGFVSPPIGVALKGFSTLGGMLPDPETNVLGQVAQYGWGNQSIDRFNNPVGSIENIASEMNMGNNGVDAADNVGMYTGQDFEGEGYDGGDGGMGSNDGGMSSVDGSEEGAAGGMADGGIINFYSNGGGLSELTYPARNAVFEGMVSGGGDGMSDSVPFSIEGQQPALLSRDEYVLPADIVSQLGDGSSGAGADMLDQFVDGVRSIKYGNTNQPRPGGSGLVSILSAAAGGSLMQAVGKV